MYKGAVEPKEKGGNFSILYGSTHKVQTIENRPIPHIVTRSTIDMSKAPITFIQWICTIPGGKKNAIESLCSSCCKSSGYNSVIIRHSEHGTTRLADGTTVKDDLHITADFVNSETGAGKAAHIYVENNLKFKSLKLLGNVQHPVRGK
ncbi:hypothetical protein N7G274_000953 [Stereocaulon virgatum]|uniref:Uncharacterized protein n=1 Tax=Stereocaulon virgatum TaxID=373712 RepID=A0ABR4ANX1_9LECA